MTTALAFVFIVMMQVGSPANTTTVIQTQAPAPDPVVSMTKAVNDPKFQAGFGSLLISGVGAWTTDFTKGMFGLLNTAWGLPGAVFHRDLHGDDRITQLNAAALLPIAGFSGVAFAVAAASNVISIRRGSQPSAAGAIISMSGVAIAVFISASSIEVLSLPMDAANLVFDTIGSATIKDYAEPGLSIANTPFPIGGIVLALMYFAIMAWLTFVFYKELAWCSVLLGESALWIFAWLLPWSVPKTIGGGLGMKFIGTCFSPAVALAALRLAAPTFANLAGDTTIGQMARIIYGVVAYEAPGVIAGAISVHMPAFGDAYLAGRAVGLFRAGPRSSGMGGGGGGAASAGAAGAASAPRPTSPGWGGSATGKTVFPGGHKWS